MQILSFYVSLIGAPNLEATDAHATLYAPTGMTTENLRNNWGPDFSPGYQFFDCLAIFFPCFTGEAGRRLGFVSINAF